MLRIRTLTAVTDDGPMKVCLYPVILSRNSNNELTYLMIRQDGMFVLDDELLDRPRLIDLLGAGVLRVHLEDGEYLYVPDILGFTAGNVLPIILSVEALFAELDDIVRSLNGSPTTADLCREAYADYLQSPDADSLAHLRDSYERVPEHLRCWLLGFEQKDAPIRKLLDLR